MVLLVILLYWNDNDITFPLLEIRKNDLRKFKRILNKYRKQNEEDYNVDDFLYELKKKKVWVKQIKPDKEIYF